MTEEYKKSQLLEEIERDRAMIERLWEHESPQIGPILSLLRRIEHHEGAIHGILHA